MKVQVRRQELRFRIDEHELGILLDGGEVRDVTRLGPDCELRRHLLLYAGTTPEFTATADLWRLRMPDSAVRRHADRLPCRDALSFELLLDGDVSLALRLDVDVRDSLRIRGARRRQAGG